MTDVVIDLDRKHRAIRSGSRWAVQQLKADGSWDMVDAWDGTRRSIYAWMADRRIVPGREAEDVLARLPETTGFYDRS